MKTVAIGPTALLCTGAVFNLVLIVCLHRTWRYWSQLKWYIVMMTVGNCLEVLFTLTTLLGSAINESWLGGDISCKFLMFMNPLGPSIANMGLAASAMHVLLTAATGRHGNCLRHALVLGLFVLLSLPLPLSKIPIFGVVKDTSFDEVLNTCTDLGFFHDANPHSRFYYFAAGSIALVFFPLIIVIGAVGGAVMVNCLGSEGDRHRRDDPDDRADRDVGRTDRTGNSSKQPNCPEVTLIAILGAVLMLLCVPLHIYILFFRNLRASPDPVWLYMSLVYVFYSKVSVTACVCAVFSLAYVYRKGRRENSHQPRSASERTKLVK
ncbi:uncharacterized protein LOC143282383 [Babylonia areolata]|uniref:uncharacterized protein LOC143282383 n=1 Tax=Babylonia areolata TaxID=304850 RepID=UPI003FD1AACD